MNTSPDFRDERSGVTVPSGVLTTILGPFQLPLYGTRSFTILNQGSLTLSGAVVQINPDDKVFEQGIGAAQNTPDAALWHTYDASAFRNMAAGEIRSYSAGANVAYRWWRVAGMNNQTPSISTSGWLMAVKL